jgi:hypothetical protein
MALDWPVRTVFNSTGGEVMNKTANALPRARCEGLMTETLGSELVVFDRVNNSAHTLNGPAAFVWQHADGTRTADEIAREMTRAFGVEADAQVVWYALDQLNQRQLLETQGRMPPNWQSMNRRQLLKRVATGAVLLAAVTSIVVPTPAHAQSGVCIPEGVACDNQPLPCCPGLGCCVGAGPTCEAFC